MIWERRFLLLRGLSHFGSLSRQEIKAFRANVCNDFAKNDPHGKNLSGIKRIRWGEACFGQKEKAPGLMARASRHPDERVLT